MTRSSRLRLFILLVIIAVIAAFFLLGLQQYLTLDYLQRQRSAFQGYTDQHRLAALGVYVLIYIAVTALSLPGALIMTLLGGALFGLLPGTIAVSFASTIGATLAFLAARFLLRDIVQDKFAGKLRAINAGIEKDGAFYLFTLRLIPIFPFFVINLVMGLTPIRATRFFWVSQLGMLPGTIVYVNAGSQLASIESLSGILSPGLLISFALLGIFPLIAKKTVDMLRSRKALRRFRKPASFDYNLIVIGAGSAGLVSAYIAAAVKARVALIEKHKMGGDCLNTGCVPSKALIRSAGVLNDARRARDFGFRSAQVEFEFAEVMERVQRVIRAIEPHDSVERYTQLGVDCIQGTAWIRSPYEVQVDGRVLTTRAIVLATGARPAIPTLPGLEQVEYFTSATIWTLRQRPERLAVLGGGPIGCELAQCFQRLGSQVTLVQRGERLLPREDADAAALIAQHLQAEGVELRLSHQAVRIDVSRGEKRLICRQGEIETAVPFDQLLIALGRKANVEGFGLEELGIRISDHGTVEADPLLRTTVPNILVCGDVAGPYNFTHVAAHQAWYAAVNALFSPLKTFRVDYSVIPWATYTDPEVAHVGLNEQQAREQGVNYEVTRYGIDDLDRAIIDDAAHGFVKVLTPPGKDKILGVTIVGAHAADLMAEFVLAMKHGIGLNKILGTIHIYPTHAEANKYAAGVWKRQHKPERLLEWVERFHAWRRS